MCEAYHFANINFLCILVCFATEVTYTGYWSFLLVTVVLFLLGTSLTSIPPLLVFHQIVNYYYQTLLIIRQTLDPLLVPPAVLTENEAPKVQMSQWNNTIPQTQQLQIHDFCTTITMQCFSYAIRSQSVLTTIGGGALVPCCCSLYFRYT